MTTLQKLQAYGPQFQTKVIGALLTQKNFLVNVSDSLEKEYFLPESLWNAIISFFPQEEPLYRYVGDWLENRLKYENIIQNI